MICFGFGKAILICCITLSTPSVNLPSCSLTFTASSFNLVLSGSSKASKLIRAILWQRCSIGTFTTGIPPWDLELVACFAFALANT